MKTLVLGTLAISAALITGCFTTNDAASKDATLSISMGLSDVNKNRGLSKGAAITYRKLIVTMVSDAATPDVLRDTIVPGKNGFTDTATKAQSVSKTYNIKPLRSWTISVKTLDQNDSVIHSASTSANNVGVGETRAVTIDLTSRFIMYVAKFTLPDSLSMTGAANKEKLNVNRFMMVVDGDTVLDSTKTSGYFTSAPTIHSIQYDYVTAGTTHNLELYVFGDMGSWPSSRPLFGDTVVVAAGPDSTYRPTLPWTGPGSPSDPDYDPANPGGAKTGLTINIGKVGQVTVEPVIDGNLGKR